MTAKREGITDAHARLHALRFPKPPFLPPSLSPLPPSLPLPVCS